MSANSYNFIFLDMDGVLVDFVSGCCVAHNKPNPYDNPDNHGEFAMEKLWGITAKEFWESLNSPGFWEDLPLMEGAQELVEMAIRLVGVGNVAILTSPSKSALCVPEKRNSIRKHFPYPALSRNMIFTGAKQFLAAPRRLLIDDADHNVDPFRAAGGSAILVPRLWNREYQCARHGAGMEAVLELLQGLH